ncbi:MarR family winged helix-turn-helix transcriptional regulator [Pseudoalteromonas peptidolytica]|uniref:MarR family winged helix-turn-helix transcriptional regulator n=1 Tax=Pseudoalteromonas peptidolytica TaxID=61150 RepID=UPI00298D6822|nr:MarR family transcriptional regulator [Pseudoalteromonas peptidolytica]MDW7549589.1 MarR family transcriptional regulator [Pseudoalteromonas peptidolytica]
MSKSNPQLNLDNQLCFKLYNASRQVTRLYQPLLKEVGLTYPQYIVLLILWEQDGQLVKEIGKRAGLNSNTLTPLLKRLEQHGIVSRNKTPDDERHTIIHLTKAGKELEQSCACIPAQVLEKSGLSMEQMQLLKSALDLLQ